MIAAPGQQPRVRVCARGHALPVLQDFRHPTPNLQSLDLAKGGLLVYTCRTDVLHTLAKGPGNGNYRAIHPC
jgi:hypothetical protein